MALDAPVQLEEVFVFEGGPDGFPELVLCHGIHAGIGYDLGVVAVDYFVKKEGVGVGGADLVEHLAPEFRVDGIGCVETPPRSALV